MSKEHVMDFSRPHRLGKRAFLLFLDKRLLLPSSILLPTLLLWTFQSFLPPDYVPYALYTIKFGFLLFIVIFLIKFLLTVFEYLGYSYKFDEEFFQVNRGYFVRQEFAIAYHQIQNVNIKRGILHRLIGVSKLVIVLARTSGQGNEVDIVLPAIDKHRGKLVQREILHRARKHFYRDTPEPKGKEPIHDPKTTTEEEP